MRARGQLRAEGLPVFLAALARQALQQIDAGTPRSRADRPRGVGARAVRGIRREFPACPCMLFARRKHARALLVSATVVCHAGSEPCFRARRWAWTRPVGRLTSNGACSWPRWPNEAFAIMWRDNLCRLPCCAPAVTAPHAPRPSTSTPAPISPLMLGDGRHLPDLIAHLNRKARRPDPAPVYMPRLRLWVKLERSLTAW